MSAGRCGRWAIVLLLGLAGPALGQPAPALHLPGAGRVAAVLETRVRDGFDQRIRYAGGDGRNHAEIALRTETGDLLLAFPPRLAKPSQFGIEGEIAVRFPGQPMRIVAAPRRNAYGPIGMAADADCLYAWQWFERPAAGRGADRGGLFGPFSGSEAGRRALSLRIRLCRTGEASLADLIAAVERMTITLPGVPAAVRRAPSMSRPAAVARRPAAPARRIEAATQPPAPPVREAPKALPPPVVSAPQPPETPARRFLAPTVPAPAAAAPVQPPADPAPEGPRRYITDVPAPAGTPDRNLTPNSAPGRNTGESLSRELPPEAYRPSGGGPR